ncbi:hypothetical protein CRP01_39245 [Flavilitoribacter nigricans DSM 23189 = NBRC 102662]|uniref:Uncharacterized protein n=1 Tax=Flavilitoribacter nigricans (strain ATCC 23147 / DSM 23189 / NBRC 102662 / NCIMB 1420 / SS-2) TaxID=1122177 RepID=A0A2D0MXY4_FLAN2|nr:hypothetical protein CRP01_39245 [Flavilitoribacter nigricans DSM 23189 = NBRC 102662]
MAGRALADSPGGKAGPRSGKAPMSEVDRSGLSPIPIRLLRTSHKPAVKASTRLKTNKYLPIDVGGGAGSFAIWL